MPTPSFLEIEQLNFAAASGDLSSLQSFLTQGHFTSIHLSYALSLSARKGYLPCIRYLIQQGASLSSQQEAFYESARYGHHDLVCYFLTQTQIDPHYHQSIALKSSIFNAHFHIARHLVQQGAHLETALETALHLPPSFQEGFEFLQWLKEYRQCQNEHTLLTNDLSALSISTPKKGRF